MMLVRQDLQFFINFFHMGAIFHFFPDILMSSTQTDKISPCVPMNQQAFPIRYFSYTSFPFKLSRTVFPTRGQHVGVRTDVVPEEPLGLQCKTMILATCVVEDVSIYLDILTLEFWAMLELPPSLIECMLIRRWRVVQRILVISQWHPLLLQQSFETRTSPVQCIGSRVVCVSLFVLPEKTSFLLFIFSKFHAGIFSSFSRSLFTAAFVSGIFIAWGMGINLCTKL